MTNTTYAVTEVEGKVLLVAKLEVIASILNLRSEALDRIRRGGLDGADIYFNGRPTPFGALTHVAIFPAFTMAGTLEAWIDS